MCIRHRSRVDEDARSAGRFGSLTTAPHPRALARPRSTLATRFPNNVVGRRRRWFRSPPTDGPSEHHRRGVRTKQRSVLRHASRSQVRRCRLDVAANPRRTPAACRTPRPLGRRSPRPPPLAHANIRPSPLTPRVLLAARTARISPRVSPPTLSRCTSAVRTVPSAPSPSSPATALPSRTCPSPFRTSRGGGAHLLRRRNHAILGRSRAPSEPRDVAIRRTLRQVARHRDFGRRERPSRRRRRRRADRVLGQAAATGLEVFEESHSEDVTRIRFQPSRRNRLFTASVDGLVCAFDCGGNPADINDEDGLLTVMHTGAAVVEIGFCRSRRRLQRRRRVMAADWKRRRVVLRRRGRREHPWRPTRVRPGHARKSDRGGGGGGRRGGRLERIRGLSRAVLLGARGPLVARGHADWDAGGVPCRDGRIVRTGRGRARRASGGSGRGTQGYRARVRAGSTPVTGAEDSRVCAWGTRTRRRRWRARDRAGGVRREDTKMGGEDTRRIRDARLFRGAGARGASRG